MPTPNRITPPGRALWVELTAYHREIYASPDIGGDDPGGGLDELLRRSDLVGAWVAEGPEGVIGLSGLLRRGSEGEVEPVIVRANRRGRGVGRALVEHVKREAQALRLTSLSIRPVARNEAAIAAFARLGFSTIGHVELFQRLQPTDGAETWRPGITIHGVELDH